MMTMMMLLIVVEVVVVTMNSIYKGSSIFDRHTIFLPYVMGKESE